MRVALLDTVVSAQALPTERLCALNADGTPARPSAQPHGTYCATAIASELRGAEGVAPQASILSIAVAHADGVPAEPEVRAGLALALEQGCDLISCSLCLQERSPELDLLLRAAHLRGIPVLVAAGNDPQCANALAEGAPNVLVVGACADGDEPLATRITPFIDVFAPGEALDVIAADGSRVSWQGLTSGATALVAGVLALGLAGFDPAQRPLFAPSVAQLLAASARSLAAHGGNELPQVRVIRPAAFLTYAEALQALARGAR